MHKVSHLIFITLLAPVMLTACSEASQPGAGLDSTTTSSTSVFAAINSALSTVSSAQRAATIQTLRAQSFHQYFADLLGTTNNASTTIDGMEFANAHNDLLASEERVVGMDQVFTSRGEFWDKVGMNTSTVTAADFAAGIRAAHGVQVEAQGADKGLALVDMPSRAQIFNGMGTFTADVGTFRQFCSAVGALRGQLSAINAGAKQFEQSVVTDVANLKASSQAHQAATASTTQQVKQLQDQLSAMSARVALCESTIASQQTQIATLSTPPATTSKASLQSFSTDSTWPGSLLSPPGTND